MKNLKKQRIEDICETAKKLVAYSEQIYSDEEIIEMKEQLSTFPLTNIKLYAHRYETDTTRN
jgi:hypothetical protein